MIKALYKHFLYPVAYFLLHCLKRFLSEKTRTMIEEKDRLPFQIASSTSQTEIRSLRPFWIHAASGEIEYARPILRDLQARQPSIPILITYSSPSAKKMLQQLEGVSAWGPLPWDFEKDCVAFLETWQPRACLFARTDVWPVMAESCRKAGIPSLLFSATFAENSSRLKGVSALATEWALNQLSNIHCVSEEDAHELKVLNLNVPVSIEGDTRFAQVLHRLRHPRPLKEILHPSTVEGKSILVAGSTWPEDESVLSAAMKDLKSSHRMILVPHEVTESHLGQVEKLLASHGLSFGRYSQILDWSRHDVLIVDQLGILAEVYTWGNVAFVGGSFRKQVHSVMEPLAAGLPVLVGPYHMNNREALQFKARQFAGIAAVQEVTSAEELVKALLQLRNTDNTLITEALQSEILALSHSSEAVLQWCESLTLQR